MSDGYGGDGYGWDPYGVQQPQILGYDEYGRPVYQQQSAQDQLQTQAPVQDHGYPQPYDGYGAYGSYDPYAEQGYATGRIPAQPYADPGYAQADYQNPVQPYADGGYGYDPYGSAADTGAGLAAVPAQARRPEPAPDLDRGAGAEYGDAADPEYDTGEFSFVEEQAEDSEDVIDWLKFSESRTERREEVKRRGRNRKRALIVLLVLAVLGSGGYLWYAGKLPGIAAGPGADTAAAGEKRDVLVVHLRTPDSEASSTALLVDNATTGRATTLLLPNSLAVSTSGGSTTTLGKSVEDEGATPTRDALGRLLGADIKGTWRLDTPFLEKLVDMVGGITLDANATVPGEKKDDDPLVKRGKDRELDGEAAVAYATHRGDGEAKAAQLKRFGQVMEAVLSRMSTDKDAATQTVKSLGQILDPSISQASLGATLAQLADRVRGDAYETELLPVQEDGTLSKETSEGLVKDVLGGTVQNSDPDAAPRVSLRNASGDEDAAASARVTLVNGGFTVVGTGKAGSVREESKVVYEKAKQKQRAEAVAKTLGISGDAVQKGDGANNADVTVVLGEDHDD